MTEQFKKELKNVDTFEEFFNVVNKHYDTKEKLGVLSKAALLANINTIIVTSGVKPKK